MWSKQTADSSDAPDREEVQTNQTQFGFDEPLFEEPPSLLDPNAVVPVAKKSHRRLMMVAGLGLLGVLLLFAALLSLRKPADTRIEATPTPTPVLNQNQDVYLSRLGELQKDFRNADPSQTTLPFPPVSLNIILDDFKR